MQEQIQTQKLLEAGENNTELRLAVNEAVDAASSSLADSNDWELVDSHNPSSATTSDAYLRNKRDKTLFHVTGTAMEGGAVQYEVVSTPTDMPEEGAGGNESDIYMFTVGSDGKTSALKNGAELTEEDIDEVDAFGRSLRRADPLLPNTYSKQLNVAQMSHKERLEDADKDAWKVGVPAGLGATAIAYAATAIMSGGGETTHEATYEPPAAVSYTDNAPSHGSSSGRVFTLPDQMPGTANEFGHPPAGTVEYLDVPDNVLPGEEASPHDSARVEVLHIPEVERPDPNQVGGKIPPLPPRQHQGDTQKPDGAMPGVPYDFFGH